MAERYEKLSISTDVMYTEGSPIVIAASALLKDNQKDKILVQVKFKNIDKHQIQAVGLISLPFLRAPFIQWG